MLGQGQAGEEKKKKKQGTFTLGFMPSLRNCVRCWSPDQKWSVIRFCFEILAASGICSPTVVSNVFILSFMLSFMLTVEPIKKFRVAQVQALRGARRREKKKTFFSKKKKVLWGEDRNMDLVLTVLSFRLMYFFSSQTSLRGWIRGDGRLIMWQRCSLRSLDGMWSKA